MERVRLTQRIASRNRKAEEANPETPIDIGKNRTYHKIDEYHTFEPSLNHWIPDDRTEWKDNPREPNGLGIPKNSQTYITAKKATKLAMMLLGSNATDASIEQQARAFMRMGNKALTASIDRWAACQNVACGDQKPAEEAPVEEPKAETACNTAAEEPAKVEEAPAPAAPAEEPKAETACNTAAEETEKKETAPADDIQIDDLDDGVVDFDAPASEDASADADIEKCFEKDDDGNEEDVAEETPTASKKAGLKKLAGQPTLRRVASKNSNDLTALWDKWSNPDIR